MNRDVAGRRREVGSSSVEFRMDCRVLTGRRLEEGLT